MTVDPASPADSSEASPAIAPIRELLYPVDVPVSPPTDLQSARALRLVGPRVQLRIIMSDRVWDFMRPHYEQVEAANKLGDRRAKRAAWRAFHKAVERLNRALEREDAQPTTNDAD